MGGVGVNWQVLGLGLINIIGGILVLGSYVQGAATHPANSGALWGNVPRRLKPFYVMSMMFAAAGYFAFSYFIFFRVDPDGARVFGVLDFRTFLVAYAFVLFPSALWMPLTFAMLAHPSTWLWCATRITLAVVGLASLGLLAALLGLNYTEPAPLYWLAVAGAAAFCLQTAVLDALVWPVSFPTRGPARG